MTLSIMPKRELSAIVRQSLIDATGIDMPQDYIDDTHDVMLCKWHDEWQPKGDLSFYGGIEYAWQTFDCWNKWSNNTMRSSLKWMTEHYDRPTSILDFGAGIGATTVQIALTFPDAKVWYSNVEGYQRETAEKLFKRVGLPNIVMADSGPEPHDCIFAIELFEHIKEPIPELDALLCYDPAVVVDGSSFHVDECGHWDEYLSAGATVTKRRMRQLFTKRFEQRGYKSAERVVGSKPFWNRHPRVFVRPERFTQG